MADAINPQLIVVRGRLSWPAFTMQAALNLNERSDPQYKKKPEDVKPSFSMVVEQAALDKLVTHLKDVFFPWCAAQFAVGPKERGALEPKYIKQMTRILDEQDWENEGIFGLINPVHEKTKALAPEGVASVKANGFKGRDLEQKAIVRSEDELVNNVDEILIPSRGLILPVDDTKHELYPGSVVSAQLNLYPFVSGKQAGITASTATVIKVGEAERFGGGGELNEDDIFMDLED